MKFNVSDSETQCAFDVSTKYFYQDVSSTGINVVAAKSGGMKSMFLCNLGTCLALSGENVLFVHLQGPPIIPIHRIYCISKDVVNQGDKTERLALADCNAGSLPLTFVDCSGQTIDNNRIIQIIDEAGNTSADQPPVSIVIIDGFDSIERQKDWKIDMDKMLIWLTNAAVKYKMKIWLTSQIQREGENLEVLNKTHLCSTMVKAEAANNVVMLGTRIQDKVLTACMTKSRDRSTNQDVYRLALQPTFRLDILNDERPIKNRGYVASEPVYINVKDGDFPKIDETAEDSIIGDDSRRLLKPYHGTRGFVQVGREVFASLLFTNRSYERFFFLMDCYQMAQFEKAEIYAPATNIPVELERGQFLTSHTMLARRWDVSKTKARDFLNDCERDGLLTQTPARPPKNPKKDPKKDPTQRALGTIITLCHYISKKNDGVDEELEKKPIKEPI